MNQNHLQVLKELAIPIIEQEQMFLVDVEVSHQKLPEIWVLVDTEEGGTNVDICSKISRKIAFLAEEQDLFDHAYRLNVSSPGLSRPLSDFRQYKKNVGRNAKVKYKEDSNYLTSEGTLVNVHQQEITLQLKNKDEVIISFDAIVETKIVPKI